MKNAAYFQQMSKSRFKHKAVKPKQKNLFYLKTMNANFSLLNTKQKARFVKDINRMFGDCSHMIEYWANKLNLSIKNSVQGVELIIP
jgi:hypothetical protein